MRISGTEPMIGDPKPNNVLGEVEKALKVSKQADAKKGWCSKPTKLQFLRRKILML